MDLKKWFAQNIRTILEQRIVDFVGLTYTHRLTQYIIFMLFCYTAW